jgi:hypothetical protein
MAIRQFESLWTLGDRVSVIFPGSGNINEAVVIKISFDEKNVLYDVDVPYRYYPEESDYPSVGHARIHGLKEWHLRIPEEDVMPKSKNENTLKPLFDVLGDAFNPKH